MKQRLILFTALFLPFAVFPRLITVKKNIYWDKAKETVVEGRAELTYLFCNSCSNDPERFFLPVSEEIVDLSAGEYIKSVRFTGITSTPVNDFSFSQAMKGEISSQLKAEFYEATDRQKNKGFVLFTPLISKNGRIEKITAYTIEIETAKTSFSTARGKKSTTFKNSSVLSNGEFYKIGVNHDGIYKLSQKYLKQQGIDIDNIDPRSIRIYGNGGGMLPEANSDFRYDDLEENSIYVSGESDGSFDKEDYVLFYGQGPNKWSFQFGDTVFRHQKHEFSDTTYYFLTVGGATNAKRLSQKNVQGSSPVNVTEFDDRDFHEVDKVNLMKSGSQWFGEVFDIQNQYSFNFSFPNIVPSSKGFLRFNFATNSRKSSSYTIKVANKTYQLPATSTTGNYALPFAASDGGSTTFNASGNVVNVDVTYNKPTASSSSKGYLDFLEVNVRRRLIMTGLQMQFRDTRSVGNSFARFRLSGASNKTKVWDITDPLNPEEHVGSFASGTKTFVNTATELREYIAFNDYDSSYAWMGLVNNQNLHGEVSYNYVIISHPRFLSAAERLADLHRNNGLSVFVTTPQRVYNEFSSGSQDIVALRDFLRMMYWRGLGTSNELMYVLMMGDGSYDNKNRIGGNTNFVPTYESFESFNPPTSYVSDDFYCLMDTNEGVWNRNELMDISIGRFPVQTEDQANKVVDKVERYMDSRAMGDWRNRVCFVGDDEDGVTHMSQADTLALRVQLTDNNYNLEKIYLDAFKQVSTPGGQRYPDAFEGIKRQVEAGVLLMNYTGHGGEVGWAHERILTMDVINNWTNKWNMPLFMTATCEFSRWDDPQRAAGGEVVLTNPNGGGIGLLTTVRLVYSSANQQLAKAFYNNIFEPINGEMPRIGDVYKNVKNSVTQLNSRNFSLLGDPALRLAYPYFNIITDSINGRPASQMDTVRALGLVEVRGHLEDLNGNKLNNFNGTIYPTVFDKEYDVESLNNDGEGIFRFKLQDKKLFRGKASVENGSFKFQFIVPKDIAYNFDQGRISYYAENQVKDAKGHEENFVIGGTDPNAADDQTGPDIEIYMNDETFVYGGITDENPVLYAKIFDEHGINMAGTGIGHDITAILDGKTDEPIILNDYYSAVINSYQEGEVRYNFEELEPGPHKLTLKVWDVYNNSSEATLEFVVEEFKEIKIDRVLNYPNPFTTNTSFWFEHNQPNTVLDVKIQIFTISGKIVKSIDQVIETSGYNQTTRNPISWNGRDEYGDKLGRGVYIYKLQVRSRRNGTMAEKIEKLVIL